MRMKRIGVIGTIGVGKSTFLEELSASLRNNGEQVITFGEPSIIHGNLNGILKKFYKDTYRWGYPLQSGISAAHEAIFAEILEEETKQSGYTTAVVDAPFSSFIYCNIHAKAGRLSEEERDAIINLSRPFEFDYIILLEESADNTIERIQARSRTGELDDLSYMYEHIEDFKLFRKGYLDKYFSKSKFIHLKGVPDLKSLEYKELIMAVTDTIINGEGEVYSVEKS